MGRKPSARLFNITAEVRRASENQSDYYERDDDLALVATPLARITTNRWFGVGDVKEQGFQPTSSHRIYVLWSALWVIKDGDHIIDGADDFRVNVADDHPGGVEESHYELWCSKVS